MALHGMENDMSQAAITDRSPQSPPYKRHRPEQTLLYQIIERHYPEFRDVMAMQGKSLPQHVQQEFADYLKCGRLEHGFLRVQCSECHHEHLVAFSCKRRGFCPSCGARRMAESAALLVDEVLPEQPIRQWVLSFPFQLRFIRRFAPHPSGQLKLFNASLLSVCQPPATDGAGAGDRLQGHIGPYYSEVGIDSENSTDRCGDVDPAVRQCAKSQCALSHAVPRRRLHHHALG
jgi:ribosomal protein S27E